MPQPDSQSDEKRTGGTDSTHRGGARPHPCDERSNLVEQLRAANQRQRIENQQLRAAHEAALRVQSALLAAVVESSQDAIVSEDMNGVILSWNRGADRLFGYSAAEAIGQPISIIFPPAAAAAEPELLHRIRRGEQVAHLHAVRLRKDGARIDVSVTYSPIRDAAGRLIGTSTIARDITAHKRTEEALRQSEENYRAIFDTANDAIFVHDLETGAILDVNQKMCEMYGCSREAALQLSVEEMSAGVPPYSQREALHWLGRAAADGPQLFEWLAKDTAGRLFWVEVNIKRVNLGGTDRLLAIVREVTERRRAEEALKESEELYRGLVELSPDAIAVHGDGKIVFANPAAARLFGVEEPQHLVGRPVMDVVHPDYRAMVAERIRQMREDGVAVRLTEAKFLRLDGATIDVEVAAMPLAYAGKSAIQVVIRDISARKQSEEALRRARDELELRLAARTAELARTTAELRTEIEERAKTEKERGRLMQ